MWRREGPTVKYENLNDEERNELESCKSPEDILALANEKGYELSEEELEEISGGAWNPVYEVLPKCPECGSIGVSSFPLPGTGVLRCVCGNCHHVWTHTPVGDL